MPRRRIRQESFGGEAQDRVTAPDELHGAIARGPVEAALAAIPAAGRCEAGWAPLALFKALLIAVWRDLSDVKLSEALEDRASFRRFCGFARCEPTPERTAVVRFRRLHVGLRLDGMLFERVNEQLRARSVTVKSGTLGDVEPDGPCRHRVRGRNPPQAGASQVVAEMPCRRRQPGRGWRRPFTFTRLDGGPLEPPMPWNASMRNFVVGSRHRQCCLATKPSQICSGHSAPRASSRWATSMDGKHSLSPPERCPWPRGLRSRTFRHSENAAREFPQHSRHDLPAWPARRCSDQWQAPRRQFPGPWSSCFIHPILDSEFWTLKSRTHPSAVFSHARCRAPFRYATAASDASKASRWPTKFCPRSPSNAVQTRSCIPAGSIP